MERTTSEKIRLGIFVVLGTVLLLLAAYFIGNQQNLFSKTFTMSATFKNVNGLKNGNNVRYSGINVGTVGGIKMLNDTTIQVSMIIQDDMRNHIKKNAVAAIGSDGLVGSMIINIVPGDENAPLVEPGDKISSLSKIATADMMSTLNVTNENAALLTKDLLKVTATLNKGEGTLGRLLKDTVMANDLQKTLVNLKYASNGANTTIQELNKLVQQFNSRESAVGVLLGDSISGEKMRSVISHLETSSIEIEKMANDLNSVVGEIKEGKGAINYLATDTTLVNQLQSTMKNVDQGVERFNENMEALKHNFLTRGYFKKQAKELEKENKEYPK